MSSSLSRRRFLLGSSTIAASAAGTARAPRTVAAKTNPPAKYLILACDGGGIRGLVTALLLRQLDADHPGFLAQAYLNAGTSTGGMISLGLACGVSPGALVNLYQTDGTKIFTPSACRAGGDFRVPQPPRTRRGTLGQSWWQFILDHLEELVCPWYDSASLRAVLEGILGAAASATLDSLVNPARPRYVLVNTLQLCDAANEWTPLQLTNLPRLQGNTSGGTQVIDAALSTGAAPVYFPPYQHPLYGFCADGGLFANNPGAAALTTLIESGVSLDQIWMLSLSTGNTQNCYPAPLINGPGAANFGAIYWMWPVAQPQTPVAGQPYTPSVPLMEAVFDATAQMDAYYCARLLPGRFQRANVPLSQPIPLDDVSPAAIQAMLDSTGTYIQQSPEWAGIGTWINTNFA
jgi:predicted acylesterase/phospholipase RssA